MVTYFARIVQFSVVLVFALCLVSGTSYAQVTGPSTATTTTQTGTVEYLKNPIKVTSITDFIKAVLDVLLKIAIPVVAFAIIYSGFLFVSARGNTEKLESAKRTFVYTLIGGAILLGAWALAQIVSETISAIAA